MDEKTQLLVDALRRMEHAPNQGDRGVLGQVADNAYKAQAFLDGSSRNNPSSVGDVVGNLIGFPSVASTADNMSRGLPVDTWEAAQAGLAFTPFIKPAVNGVKSAANIAKALMK